MLNNIIDTYIVSQQTYFPHCKQDLKKRKKIRTKKSNSTRNRILLPNSGSYNSKYSNYPITLLDLSKLWKLKSVICELWASILLSLFTTRYRLLSPPASLPLQNSPVAKTSRYKQFTPHSTSKSTIPQIICLKRYLNQEVTFHSPP